jgi:hypothetical protein
VIAIFKILNDIVDNIMIYTKKVWFYFLFD